ncbi:type II toxin-antitoxin system mRNA interferase toxin, RelE/StbE family [Candidatus Microgenomates bacterium]|nr:type II toxin-antitoxin system mRNA interferase toxin, RelE/StbE family [Candidatus Microgenomates bacterium]
MKIQYDPDFLKKLKKVNVRIRKNFETRIRVFLKDPNDPQLNNHPLREHYLGFRSIDITADYRAFYEEVSSGEETIAYFSALGTHDDLYGKEE